MAQVPAYMLNDNISQEVYRHPSDYIRVCGITKDHQIFVARKHNKAAFQITHFVPKNI